LLQRPIFTCVITDTIICQNKKHFHKCTPNKSFIIKIYNPFALVYLFLSHQYQLIKTNKPTLNWQIIYQSNLQPIRVAKFSFVSLVTTS
jgi:hypothetical protein